MPAKKTKKSVTKSAKKPTKEQESRFSQWFHMLPHWLQVVLGSWVLKAIVGCAVFIYIFMWTGGTWFDFIRFPEVQNPNYGVSFSAKRARELGLDPHANLTALLSDMKIKNYRLMSYWDETESTRGTFDFSELDWEVNEVAKYGGTVSLSVGLRQPRWPECHQPNWAYELKGNVWKQALYAYMEVVVKRYEKNSTVISWQLENEAYNNWFGTCDLPDDQRVKEEFALLSSWTEKPIWMSLSDQHGYPINQPVPDKYGYSVYRWVWNTKFPPYGTYLIYPTPVWYHRLRAAIIKAYTGKDIFIHELQLEPWGPSDTKDLSVEEQNKSMSLQQIHDSLAFAREIGAKDIYVWGGEWWYWRMVNGDPSVWNTVKHELGT